MISVRWFSSWADALAVANGYAFARGTRYRVFAARPGGWLITEVHYR